MEIRHWAIERTSVNFNTVALCVTNTRIAKCALQVGQRVEGYTVVDTNTEHVRVQLIGLVKQEVANRSWINLPELLPNAKQLSTCGPKVIPEGLMLGLLERNVTLTCWLADKLVIRVGPKPGNANKEATAPWLEPELDCPDETPENTFQALTNKRVEQAIVLDVLVFKS